MRGSLPTAIVLPMAASASAISFHTSPEWPLTLCMVSPKPRFGKHGWFTNMGGATKRRGGTQGTKSLVAQTH